MSIGILTFDVTSHDSLKMGAIIAEISVLHPDQVHYVHLIPGKSQSYKVLQQYWLDRAFNVEPQSTRQRKAI